MAKRLSMILAGALLSTGVAFAQSQVTGTVTDENGEPVVGAAVRIDGTKTGTVTDVDGHFSLSAPSNSRLTVSYLGMQTKTVKSGGNMKIVLQSDNQQLDEVMVVAFGKQTKSSFTGSAAVVNAEDISKKISTNVADALVGSVPGLQITGSSGQPGASEGDIHIRGISSMYASTTPLIVVDGAPYNFSLSNIPQEDIESVTVLKDAASAALYGARGASGVILITTKHGDSQKAHVSIDAKWGGTSRAVQDYETINDPGEFMETYYKQFYNYAYYKQGMSNAAANQWVNDRMITGSQWGLQYNPFSVPDGENLIGLDGKLNPNAKLGRTYTYNGNTYYLTTDNWLDAAYHNGNRQEYTATISGGSQRGSYYTSLGYLNEDGIIDKSSYERFSGRIKADYKVTDWLTSTVNMNYVHSNMAQSPNLENNNGNSANLAFYSQYIAPIYPLYVRMVDANGNPYIVQNSYGGNKYDYGVPSTGYQGNGTRLFLATGNPIGSNRYNEDRTTRNQFNSQFNFDVQFTPWLRLTSVNTLSYDMRESYTYNNPYEGPTASENGRLIKDDLSYFTQNYSQTLNFHKTFGLHDVQVMVGHEWYKQKGRYLDAYARGGFSPDIKEINAFGNRYDSHSYSTMYNVEGYFGNALYNYDERYFLQGSYRRDASSRFAKDHRWGDFWSAGAAWIFSKEKFFKDLNADWVDNLKLKFSIGQQGNDGIGNFQYVDLYSLSKSTTGMLPSFYSIGNPDITWETNTNMNIGLEFNLFRNRLNGEVNFYNRKTTNLLNWMSIPESYGARGYYGNMGDIRNRGWEIILSGDIIRTKHVVWSGSFNIAFNSTKILSLPETKTANYGGYGESNDDDMRNWYTVGGPLYNAMMPEYAGVNEQGEALYWIDDDLYQKYAVKGSQTAQSQPGTKHSRTTTNWSEATYYTQGSTLPKANGGFSSTVSAYGFDATVTFDYQLGGKIYDYTYASLMENVSTTGNGYALHKDILKSWTPDNTSSNIPRFMYGDLYTTSESTRFLTSARYLNFQSFVVGYTLPADLTRRFLVSKMRIYVQGENLGYWSARKGLDPRYSYSSMGGRYGVRAYAPTRTIMGGVQITF